MARPSTKFANINSDQQRQQLTVMWKTHHCHYTRIRAHAVLLSDQHYEISAIVDIFGVDRDSVSSWIDRFADGGPEALEDSDHPGAPPILDDAEQQVLRTLLRKHPNRPANTKHKRHKKGTKGATHCCTKGATHHLLTAG